MTDQQAQPTMIREVLPKTGLVYSEKTTLTELLCKPKIMPIKSMALERLEQLESEAKKVLSQGAQSRQGSGAPGSSYGQRRLSSAAGNRPQSATQRPSSAVGGRNRPQ